MNKSCLLFFSMSLLFGSATAEEECVDTVNNQKPGYAKGAPEEGALRQTGQKEGVSETAKALLSPVSDVQQAAKQKAWEDMVNNRL